MKNIFAFLIFIGLSIPAMADEALLAAWGATERAWCPSGNPMGLCIGDYDYTHAGGHHRGTMRLTPEQRADPLNPGSCAPRQVYNTIDRNHFNEECSSLLDSGVWDHTLSNFGDTPACWARAALEWNAGNSTHNPGRSDQPHGFNRGLLKLMARNVDGDCATFYPVLMTTQVWRHSGATQPFRSGIFPAFSQAEWGRFGVRLCQEGRGRAGVCSPGTDDQQIRRTTYARLGVPQSRGTVSHDQNTWVVNMIRDRCRVHAPSTNDADQDTADGRRWQVEQDIAQALAISRYVPSGHGAFARVITVRATWAWVGSTASGIDIQNSGEEILVCKEGFRPNTSRTDCEMINPALCTRARCDNPADCDTFDRERIYFGPGRTQTPITDQCWQRMDATEFVTCVRGS